MTTERVIEVPWALMQLPQSGLILDVGSGDATYSAQIQQADRAVRCMDPRLCPSGLPKGAIHYRQSIIGNDLPRTCFDAVLMISVLEHIGLPCYGQAPFPDGDQLALAEVWELLKPGAPLIATVPAGCLKVASWYRQYNPKRLRQLFRGWRVEICYWGFDGARYALISGDDVEQYDYFDYPLRAGAVAGIVAHKTVVAASKHEPTQFPDPQLQPDRLSPPRLLADEETTVRTFSVRRPGTSQDIAFDVVVGAHDQDIFSQAIVNQCILPIVPLYELIFELIRPDSLLLDLGANIGTVTLRAAALGCRVIAVEASPNNAALLQASVEHNHFDHVRVIHAAVSNHHGWLEFFPNGPHGVIASAQVPNIGATVRVPATTVDILLQELGNPRVDFMKIDIEGAEMKALHGMPRLLSSAHSPLVIYESSWHTAAFFGETPRTLKTVFEHLGYQNYLIENHRLVPVRAADFQPECNADYLAVKQMPIEIPGWPIAPPLSREEVIQKLLADAVYPNADVRRHPARVLQEERGDWLDDARVRAALEALARDPELSVRAAAAWFR